MADEVSFVGQRNRLREGMKPITLKSTKNLVISQKNLIFAVKTCVLRQNEV